MIKVGWDETTWELFLSPSASPHLCQDPQRSRVKPIKPSAPQHFEGSFSGLTLLQLITERLSWRFGTAVSSVLEFHQTTKSLDQIPNPHKSQSLSLNIKTQAYPCHVCLLSHNSPAQLFPVGISVSLGTVAITAVLFHLNTYLSSCPKRKHFISTSSPWLQPTALGHNEVLHSEI